MTYMLDANICIYVMKNKPEKVLERFKKELEYGMKNSFNPPQNEQSLLKFLLPLSILPFEAVAASEYWKIGWIPLFELSWADPENEEGYGCNPEKMCIIVIKSYVIAAITKQSIDAMFIKERCEKNIR